MALTAYTPYVIPVAFLSAAVSVGLRQWAAAAVAGVAAIALIVVIAPRAVGGPDDMEGTPLRVLSANVLHGGANAGSLTSLVREHRVDVLAVQELTPKFAARFRKQGGVGLLPHTALDVREGVSGSGIYSRFPVQAVPTSAAASSQALVMLAPGKQLAVRSVHNLPLPTSSAGTSGWSAALGALPAATEAGPPRLLAGDFNATLDQGEFRDVIDRGYADAAERMGRGLTPTWPSFRVGFRYLPVTIDHVLYDRDRIGVRDYQVLDLPDSDHHPIYAELSLSG